MIRELYYTLLHAWKQADLINYLHAWYWTITHTEFLTSPIPYHLTPLPGKSNPGGTILTPRQAHILLMAAGHNPITNRYVRRAYPHLSPEAIRLDFAHLVRLDLLRQNGSKGMTSYTITHYTAPKTGVSQ